MEIMDVVNDNDETIDCVPIEDIYAKKLPHRIVHILVFDDKERMALQLRSKHKPFCPLHWSTAVGGRVQAGETYEEAAHREFQEELGESADVSLLYKENYTDECKKFLGVFKALHNGPFSPDPEEVEKVEFFTLVEIQHMIEQGEPFHPELLFLLRRFITLP